MSFWDITGKSAEDIGTMDIIEDTIAQFNVGGVTAQERLFLLNNTANYDRAVKERTLNRLETERGISLNQVMVNGKGTSPSEFVQYTIGFVEEKLGDSRKRYVVLEGTPYGDREKTLIDKRLYILRALKRNRKWLEERVSELHKG